MLSAKSWLWQLWYNSWAAGEINQKQVPQKSHVAQFREQKMRRCWYALPRRNPERALDQIQSDEAALGTVCWKAARVQREIFPTQRCGGGGELWTQKTASVTSLAFSVHTAGSEVSWVNSVNSERAAAARAHFSLQVFFLHCVLHALGQACDAFCCWRQRVW